MRTHVTILLLSCILHLAAVTGGGAASLSANDCAEIWEKYQFQPNPCVNLQRSEPAITVTSLAPVSENRRNPHLEADHVFFPNGGVAFDAKAKSQIEDLVTILNGQVLETACLSLIGHSDSSGSAAANIRIGQQRAEAVQLALVNQNLRPTRIEVVTSRGEAAPLPDFPPDAVWQRRVEIRARDCPPDVKLTTTFADQPTN